MNSTIKFPSEPQQAYIPDMKIMVRDIDTVAKIYTWLSQQFPAERKKTMTVFSNSLSQHSPYPISPSLEESSEESRKLTDIMNSGSPEEILESITKVIHKYNCNGVCFNAALDLPTNRYFSVGCFLSEKEKSGFLMKTHTRMESRQWPRKGDAKKCEEAEAHLGVAFIEYIKSLGCSIIWFDDSL